MASSTMAHEEIIYAIGRKESHNSEELAMTAFFRHQDTSVTPR